MSASANAARGGSELNGSVSCTIMSARLPHTLPNVAAWAEPARFELRVIESLLSWRRLPSAALLTMSTAIVAASSEMLYAHAQVSAVILDTTARACWHPQPSASSCVAIWVIRPSLAATSSNSHSELESSVSTASEDSAHFSHIDLDFSKNLLALSAFG